jgi:hypothetical protein
MTNLHALVAGAGSQQLVYADPVFPDRPITLYAACPAGFTPDMPVLFSHHGRSRNGADYRDYFLRFVDTTKMLVIAPEFSDAAFPGQPWYNAGNMLDASGTPNPPEFCTYAIIPRLFAALQAAGITRTRRYGLFGHSAGSQFVHRQVTFGHAGAVAVAVAANAGTYTMPDPATPFPYGLGGTAIGEAGLRALLGFPLIVMAGTADNSTDAPFVPRDPGSLRQGAHRYERTYAYMAAGKAAAEQRAMTCAWRIIDVPGVAHEGDKMATAAAPVLAVALHGSL